MIKKIIDAHHHFWDLELNKNEWLVGNATNNYMGDIKKIRHSYLTADFLGDARKFSIAKSVHIQAGWDKNDTLGESQWLNQLYIKSGFPHAIVAYADLSDRQVEATLEKQALIPNVKGIRQIINWHEDPFYRDCDKNYLDMESWRGNFSLLEKYNLSFDMQIYPEQVDAVLPIISDVGEIGIAIDHALMPVKRDREYLLYWRKQLKKLSIFPNVKIKISGIAMFDHAWNMRSFSDILLPVIEIFSPSRCMIGSNFPVDKLYGSYEAIMSAYVAIISQYSEEEQADIFYNTAAGFYGI